VATADLVGPDEVTRAPTIAVTAKQLSLNGRSVEEAALEPDLDTLHNRHRILHPGQRAV
jgi:hypothetical protein